jgi:hypothetical protein
MTVEEQIQELQEQVAKLKSVIKIIGAIIMETVNK